MLKKYTNAPTNKGLHANVIKYSKKDGKIYRTFYNAGAGVRADNSKLNQVAKYQFRKRSKVNSRKISTNKASYGA